MRRTLLLLSASLLTITACTPQTTGTPSPSSSTLGQTSSSGSADEVPGPGVPKVENPIDVSHFQQAPCDALTANQVDSLLGQGVSPKSDLKGQAGPECFWHSPNVSQAGVGVIFTNADKLGLTSVYAARGTKYPFFKPLEPVDGYPLVAYDGEGDQSAKGRCTVAVGASDTQAIDISVAQSEENIGKDPCVAARDVAGKVLANLKAGK
jgi:uncharacterized protein DUF3558